MLRPIRARTITGLRVTQNLRLYCTTLHKGRQHYAQQTPYIAAGVGCQYGTFP